MRFNLIKVYYFNYIFHLLCCPSRFLFKRFTQSTCESTVVIDITNANSRIWSEVENSVHFQWCSGNIQKIVSLVNRRTVGSGYCIRCTTAHIAHSGKRIHRTVVRSVLSHSENQNRRIVVSPKLFSSDKYAEGWTKHCSISLLPATDDRLYKWNSSDCTVRIQVNFEMHDERYKLHETQEMHYLHLVWGRGNVIIPYCWAYL